MGISRLKGSPAQMARSILTGMPGEKGPRSSFVARHRRKTPALRLAILGAFLVASTGIIVMAGGVFRTLQDKALSDLAKNRSNFRGIVDIYRANALEVKQVNRLPFEEALRETIHAPDVNPEVAAHAASVLAFQLANEGKMKEAHALATSLGFVTHWRVIGPFDDDNKVGYDSKYPPENKLEYEGSYMGKGHQVSWRAAPSQLTWGIVPMGQLIDPAEKVVGYAMSFVRVGRKTPCVIRGGYNEAYKLWVDGEEVGGRKIYNGLAFDQYADSCTLRKGWNIILVKLCNQSGGWNFEMRLTDSTGRALQGIQDTNDPRVVKEKLASILFKDGSPEKKYTFDDPEAVLKAAAKKSKLPGDEETYGLYTSFLQTFDRVDPKNVDILKKAAEEAGNNPAYWLALSRAEQDHNKRRDAAAKALKVSPDYVPALLDMADYYSQRGMTYAALPYLQRAVKAAPSDPITASSLYGLQLEGVSDAIAFRKLAKLYRAAPDCYPVRETYFEALNDMDRYNIADEVSRRIWRNNLENPTAWSMVLSELIGNGKENETVNMFKAMVKRFPLHQAVFYRFASYLLKFNRPVAAEAVIKPVLDWAPDWPGGHELLGDILDARGKVKSALEEYKTALLLKPQLVMVRRKVAFLSPEKKGFESNYRVPAKEVPSDLSGNEGQQAVVLLDNTVVKVQTNGMASRYVQRVIQVLKAGAAQQLQYIPISFDPDRQEVKVLGAYIIKPDGSKVHANTGVTDYLSDPQFRLYYRNRNLVLSFPSLKAGDRIWIEYKISDVGQSNQYGRYFGDLVLFGGVMPVLEKEYTLILPKAFPLYFHSEKLNVSPMEVSIGKRKIYRWVARNLTRIGPEPNMPGMTDLVPYLHVSTFKTWDAMGSWYAGFIKDQWVPTREMKALVKRLTKGAKNDTARVEAIHRWVVQKTRYVGLEFGVHGIRPYKVRQIFARRFGDCKDKALLMAVMLREAGLDAAIVLVRIRSLGAVYPEPASLAIFNHAICYVPELHLFLDGTAEYSGATELPYQDQDVWVQVVWPDGRTKRMKTPVDKPGDDTYKAKYDLSVSKDSQDAAVSCDIVVKGVECAWIRQRYHDAGRRREMLQKDLSGTFPGTHLTSASGKGILTLKTPVRISFKGTLGQVARPDGSGRVSLPTWMGHLKMSSSMASLDKRTYPVVLDYPWSQSYDVTYHLPPGAVAKAPPLLDLKSPFGAIERKVESRKGVLRVVTEVRLDVTRVATRDYAAFKNFCQSVDSALGQHITVDFGGGQP